MNFEVQEMSDLDDDWPETAYERYVAENGGNPDEHGDEFAETVTSELEGFGHFAAGFIMACEGSEEIYKCGRNILPFALDIWMKCNGRHVAEMPPDVLIKMLKEEEDRRSGLSAAFRALEAQENANVS